MSESPKSFLAMREEVWSLVIPLSRILITGGNGLIGSHLAEVLLEKGHLVNLLDMRFDWHTESLNVKKIEADVLDYQSFKRAAESSDVIVHLAALSRVADGEIRPEECRQVNTGGSVNAADIASSLGIHLVFGSSREVYGNSNNFPIREESPKIPISVYAKSKLEAEEYIRKLGSVGNLCYTIVRFSNVYGSVRDRPERVIPRFASQAMSGAPITVHDGRQVMDFTFIDDVARNLARLIELSLGRICEDYNIVTGRSISVMQLAETIKNYTDSSSPITISPEEPFYVSKFIGDSSKAREFLGNEFALRNVEDGLKLYIQRMKG